MIAPRGDAGYAMGDALREQGMLVVHGDPPPPRVSMPFPWSIGIIAAMAGALASSVIYELRRIARARRK